MNDAMLEETDPPDTFLYTLRPYQKQALTWMSARETGKDNLRDTNQTLHPLWEEYVWGVVELLNVIGTHFERTTPSANPLKSRMTMTLSTPPGSFTGTLTVAN